MQPVIDHLVYLHCSSACDIKCALLDGYDMSAHCCSGVNDVLMMQAIMHYGESIKAIGNEVRPSTSMTALP